MKNIKRWAGCLALCGSAAMIWLVAFEHQYVDACSAAWISRELGSDIPEFSSPLLQAAATAIETHETAVQ